MKEESACRTKAMVAVKKHLGSMGRYYTTLPDLMGYFQVFCVVLYPLMHALGCPRVVAGLHILKEVVDSADGMVARRIGQCTNFGALLDLSTDTVAEYALMACIALAAHGSTYLCPMFTGLGFTAFLVLFMWLQTIDVAINFYFLGQGRSWKKEEYDCPITRWYYKNEWNHNFLFNSWHLFYVGFYLQASGETTLGSLILCATVVPFMMRARCLYVVQKSQFRRVYDQEVLQAAAEAVAAAS
uniref:CDP-diacylglycerol--inositol 3-phosphatidyltransferase n=1 Tax=Haptolina brevifila TaxID=156173 RepID=A0A7S2MLT1_9EUKA